MMNEPVGAVQPAPVPAGDSTPAVWDAAWESDTTAFGVASVPNGTVTPEDAAVTDASVVVRALLRLSGLAPSPAETEALVAGFVTERAAVRALYHVSEARYVEPALVFTAAP